MLQGRQTKALVKIELFILERDSWGDFASIPPMSGSPQINIIYSLKKPLT